MQLDMGTNPVEHKKTWLGDVLEKHVPSNGTCDVQVDLDGFLDPPSVHTVQAAHKKRI